jgi:hypothetical protein
MDGRLVSTRINRPKNNEATLLKPAKEPVLVLPASTTLAFIEIR